MLGSYRATKLTAVQHRWKPWKQSTGANTLEGKKQSSQNAYKTGKSLEIREMIKKINELLRMQKNLML